MRAPALIKAAAADFSQIQEGVALPINPPSIPGLGVTSGFEMWLQQKGSGSYGQLVETMKKIVAKAKERPELRGVSATASANSRQLLVDVDRDKAETLGVPVQDREGAVGRGTVDHDVFKVAEGYFFILSSAIFASFSFICQSLIVIA